MDGYHLGGGRSYRLFAVPTATAVHSPEPYGDAIIHLGAMDYNLGRSANTGYDYME